MTGDELRRRGKRLGYSQETLVQEFGLGSRPTSSTWGNSAEVSRLVELAKVALANLPECRRVHGKRVPARERRAFERNVAATDQV